MIPAETLAPEQPAEHLVYARVLELGTHGGLLVVVAAFAASVSGLLPPWLPVQRLAGLWQQPAANYLAHGGLPAGWGWLALLRHGDVAGLLGIALLCACPLPGLLALAGPYWRRGQRTLALLCLGQAMVLAVAATGWLG